MKVTILSKELIGPSSLTPSHLKTYNLSCLDQCWPPCYFPFILCYSYSNIDHDHNQSTNVLTPSNMTILLKTSLSNTLTHFYPLAGRLSKDGNTVDCTDEGVRFLVARVDESSLSDFVKNNPTTEQVKKLMVAELPSFSADEPLAIQVNIFNCGGIVVGVSPLHKIGDACSFSSFVSHWFATAKGLSTESTNSSPVLTRPFLDSAVLFPPMDDQSAHTCSQNQKGPKVHVAESESHVTKRFIFSSLTINKLKYQLMSTMKLQEKPPSKVEVVTALIWKFGTQAFNDCKASVASHVVNFRKKMVPSLQNYQFGNLIQMATTAIAHQNGLEDMACLVTKLRVSFGKIDSEYLKMLTGENRVEIATRNFTERNKYMTEDQKDGDDPVRIFKFNSWCKLGFTRNDFGWGKPIWVCCTGNPYNNYGVFLIDSVWDDGIEAWVTLSLDNMHKFEHNAVLQQFFG
uniref:stemmadenine O-acetyltransferase-like n=1 Tax=Erigeron canadensis TaxID=72917 RepID=UPI001CB9BA1E|nr:stemmadenine O-acetyltransferase-like [Erigeron canadensis]